MALEIWVLNHPQLGRIEAQFGYDQDFHDAAAAAGSGATGAQAGDGVQAGEAPGWSEEGSEYEPLLVGDSLRQRALKSVKNPSFRMQLVQNGRVLCRLAEIPSARIPLVARPAEKLAELETLTVAGGKDKPSVKVQRNPFGEVQVVELRRGGDVVEFDPPVGSRGAAYREAVESSGVKRFFLTAGAGLSKGGWALFILVFGGVFSRIIDWLISLLPDWELPDLKMPELPDIELPVPTLPRIELPVPTWPTWDIDLPDAPDWVIFILDYTNIWVPILIGIIAGIIALRNHKKSETKKREWENSHPRPED